MKPFLYFMGALLLTTAAVLFNYLRELPPIVPADFDITGILFLVTVGPRVLLFVVTLVLLVGGLACFIIPRMQKFQPVMKSEL